ncbi:beta-ketoacyl-ACP reductase [Adhaeribacter arboris]|uniref:Beta-ketoacyl-ACP reductase n=1 Tax=Adhaeribacter arboris TaxID=2072846 RepID=A0A2T2YPM1_9BACT|nr:beta-ketoacyl synthase N-terminal-like domain-containing protein [Adhaeribacter arboris]PSR57438.1 beta-ketoacyl-ACP reductase [Adhaeribacter arboris]
MSTKKYIVIKGFGSISPLGANSTEVDRAYCQGKPIILPQLFNNSEVPVAAISPENEKLVTSIQQENRLYRNLDRTVLMAIHAARQALQQAGWKQEEEIAVNIGSSRGATSLFEQYYQDFQKDPNHISSQISPTTTLGNISSWVANDLSTEGPVISHSVTCSTALQALANGFAWLQSGMAFRFLAGAAEAPLTPFTIAQMRAIGIYATQPKPEYWCRPLNKEKQNTFVLGEGAALFALEQVPESELSPETIILEAIGFGFEKITSKTGISPEGSNFQKAIRNATQALSVNDSTIDAVVLHAPGTVAGDAAEIYALKAVFGRNLSLVTSNKFLIGHTLGASAALSLEYALWILQHQQYTTFPYPIFIEQSKRTNPIRRIMILAAGFGGNASALIVRKGI